MKKTTILTMVVVCGALALALPDWKKPLNAAYPTVKFALWTDLARKGDGVTDSLTIGSGCPALTTKFGVGSMRLYDNGSFVLARYDSNLVPSIYSGSWYLQDNAKSTKKVNPDDGSWALPGSVGTIYLILNTVSLGDLFSELDASALAKCQTKASLAGMTQWDIMDPSVLVKKSSMVFKTIKDKRNPPSLFRNTVTATLQMSGKQQNDAKGTLDAVGGFSFKTTIKGQWIDCQSTPPSGTDSAVINAIDNIKTQFCS